MRNRLPGAAITLSADSCILEGFIARDSSYGIRAMSNNNIISGNNATKNSYGFQLASSNGNTVSDNNAFDNTGYGIYVVNSSSNEILDNRFIGSDTRNGICLSDSRCNNNIIGNTATGNKGAGILLQINSTATQFRATTSVATRITASTAIAATTPFRTTRSPATPHAAYAPEALAT